MCVETWLLISLVETDWLDGLSFLHGLVEFYHWPVQYHAMPRSSGGGRPLGTKRKKPEAIHLRCQDNILQFN